ncbi:kinase-like domain-containing protein [Rhizophagus clarus]|uniref:Kinase-like domain-containing protein n=1 Tax=Rhizophagus clarus TaxID=94130 RepID=A0A8H3LXM2_9GLOM|nr:kinase-like domain-containing protein [Rhizophagus clarus]
MCLGTFFSLFSHEILQSLREEPIPNTPEEYIKAYTDCWNEEPDNRPTINQVIVKLKSIISKLTHNSSNISSDTSTSEVISTVQSISSENNFNIVADKIIKEIHYKTNKNKQNAFEAFQRAAKLRDNTVRSKEEFMEGIASFGSCYFEGIGTSIDRKKAFKLFQKAANLRTIELFKKLADEEYSERINYLGVCYLRGNRVSIDNKKAFELFQRAENLGNSSEAQYNLACMYKIGDGVMKDTKQAS